MNPTAKEYNPNTQMNIARSNFNQLLKQYLEDGIFKHNQTKEFEIRFGTNSESSRPLSKIDYDNVVKQLLRSGFSSENKNGSQMLRINYQDSLTNENLEKTGKMKMSNIRAEVVGVDLIQEYCRTNSIQKIVDMPSNFSNKIQFTQKSSTKNAKGEWQRPVDMFDMNFRVSYQYEQMFHTKVPFIKSVIDTWSDRKKTFRMMNRVRFSHPDFPVFADLSIVRSSKKFAKSMNGGGIDGGVAENEYHFKRGGTNVAVPTYTIQEAGVFDNTETYEIEIELDNSRIGIGHSMYDTPEKVMNMLRAVIRIVLCGIQKCNYPISFTERDEILHGYMNVVREIGMGGEQTPTDELRTRPTKINFNNKFEFFRNFSFIGPSSITLQREHILPKKEGSTLGNVLENYTVTDKADGERKLLYIHENGRIYLLDNNFNVEFTGMKTDEKTIYNTILDGEHIKHDKQGRQYYLYAAFDAYFIHGKNFRKKLFYTADPNALPADYRLLALQEVIQAMKPISIVSPPTWKEKIDTQTGNIVWVNNETGVISPVKPQFEKTCSLIIQSKHFEITSENKTIFECCLNILNKIDDGLFAYHTDGLIFTPSNVGVGGSAPGMVGPLTNATWELSFKWKPVEQNTVDFLVTVKKDKTGKDEILHILSEGTDLTSAKSIEQYKTLELMCGYNEKDDGYLNPYQNILDDNIPPPLTKLSSNQNRRDYRPELFRPSDPYDANAYITKMKLKHDGVNAFMISEEGDYFEDCTIVEFRYDMSLPVGMRWVPLRVRYDKTQKLRNGEKQFGNSYRVANSNWKSIHYPVTPYMISTGDIPEFVEEEGVYYKGNVENNTQGLRDFHNLYVKRKLITKIANSGNTLIDYAVGMAGDLSKWIASKLSFVFGIDIAFSNIHNNKRGACARYLNMRRDDHSIPGALFVVGDSGLNIRELNAFPGDTNSKDKMVVSSVFGKGPKDETILGKGTVKWYGVGEFGFNISSCQFAIHYFFENHMKLHGFLRNLAECTKINGYFIGTCYDGMSIFKMLQKKSIGESRTFMTKDRNGKQVKICEIIKQYHDSGFPGDNTSVGYAIDVYQESINQVVREYLVNFAYLTEVMGHYGFTLITLDEAKQLGLPANSGLFSELFDSMKKDIQLDKRSAANYKDAPYMTDSEKAISFLNRYFVFKKTAQVDAKKITKILLKSGSGDLETPIEMSEIEEEWKKTAKKRQAVQGEIKKTKIRVKLQKVGERSSPYDPLLL